MRILDWAAWVRMPLTQDSVPGSLAADPAVVQAEDWAGRAAEADVPEVVEAADAAGAVVGAEELAAATDAAHSTVNSRISGTADQLNLR
jgi:hypothetical protein